MRKNLAAALVALLALAVTACNKAEPTSAGAASGPVQPVQAAAPPLPTSSRDFVASGPLIVENQLDVAAQREGIVTKIMAEPGTAVKRDQILGMLDDRQIATDLEAARAKTRSTEADLKNWEAETRVLQADYERAQKMWDAQLITKEQLDHAKYKAESDQWDVKRVQEMLKNNQAAERSLELELEKTRIRAPFAGVVARRYVRVGQKVATGDRLFWVTATAPLQVKFTLPGSFGNRIKKGAELQMTSPDLPSDRHKVRILEFSPVVDPSSDTIEVLAEVLGPPGELRPGMTANVRFENAP